MAAEEALKDKEPGQPLAPPSKKGILGQMKGAKRTAMIAGGGIFFAFGLLMFFILFMLGFKLNHIKNLFIDYQFAGFHRSMSRRIDHIITEGAVLDDASSAGLKTGKGASLYERMRGFRPNEALRGLGENGLKLEMEKGGVFGEDRLRSFTDPVTGEKVYHPKAKDVPEGAKQAKNLKEYKAGLKAGVENASINENAFFKRRSMRVVAERSGIKFTFWDKWKDKFGNKEPTPAESDKTLREQQIDEAKRLKSTTAEVGNAAEEDIKAFKETGKPAPLNEKFGAIKKIGDISQLAFIATMYCIVRDMIDQVDQALDTRVDNMMKVAAQTFTMADQQKEGKSPDAAAIDAANRQFDGFESSAAYQRASGLPVTGKDLSPNDRPMTIMGLLPDQAKTVVSVMNGVKDTPIVIASGGTCLIPGVNKLCSKLNDLITGPFCRVALNPYVQGTIAIGELVAAILTVGAEKGVTQAAFVFLEQAAKLAGGIAVSEYVFGHVIPGFVHDVSGVAGAGGTDPLDRTNRLDAGTNLMKNSVAVGSGAHPISNSVAREQTHLAFAERDRRSSLVYRTLALNNPRSLAARFVAGIPATPNGYKNSLNNMFAMITQPSKLMLAFSSPAWAAADDNTYYGIPQYGWADDEINGTASGFDFVSNTKYVESNFDSMQKIYQDCFNSTLGELAWGKSTSKKDKDFGRCSEGDAKRYGMYILDCYSVDTLIGAGDNNDYYRSSPCSQLVGTENEQAPSENIVSEVVSKCSVPNTDAPPPNDYSKVKVNGHTLNNRTKAMLDNAQDYAKAMGAPSLRVIQGSYNAGGVQASGGTHDGGGAIDVSVVGMDQKQTDSAVKALRQAGFAAWHRSSSEGNWDAHIHGIAIGDRQASQSAQNQVFAYFDDRSGLSGHNQDKHLKTIGRPIPGWAKQYGDPLCP